MTLDIEVSSASQKSDMGLFFLFYEEWLDNEMLL
jgi:hypothetical protein